MQEVQIKAPKHEFTILCDDIRQEMGGKASLMGLYDHHIVVPEVPFVLPKVCFFSKFSRMDGQFKFSFSVVSPNGERKDIIRDSDVQIPEGAKEGTFNVIASPFEVGAEGVYEVILGLTKGADRFEYVYKFAISNAQRLQAEWVQAFYRIAISKPFIESISWLDLADYEGHYLPHGGLCRNDMDPKLAYRELRNFKASLAADTPAIQTVATRIVKSEG